jgi:hypothetical protein
MWFPELKFAELKFPELKFPLSRFPDVLHVPESGQGYVVALMD